MRRREYTLYAVLTLDLPRPAGSPVLPRARGRAEVYGFSRDSQRLGMQAVYGVLGMRWA